jgi:hypothetical protein
VIHTFVQSYNEWLEAKQPEVPDTTKLVALIQGAGMPGIWHHRLRRAVTLTPATLDRFLASLVALGQIRVLDVGGHRVYQAID